MQRAIREFWPKLGGYIVNISDLVLSELGRIGDEALKAKVLELVAPFTALRFGESEKLLADEYVRAGVVPRRFIRDAQHIAIASFNNIEVFVSWNFRHIVNIRTRRLVNEANMLKGYRAVEIVSPLEL